MTRAVIALGSNLGNRVEFLTAAIAALEEVEGIRVLAVSPWYESIAHTATGPDAAAPRYANGVAIIDSQLSAEETLREMHEVEGILGRPIDHERFSSRTLDLDLIVFDQLSQRSSALTLPHPRAHERVFVLRPWLDLDPDAELPGRGRVEDLLAACRHAERDALTPLEPR